MLTLYVPFPLIIFLLELLKSTSLPVIYSYSQPSFFASIFIFDLALTSFFGFVDTCALIFTFTCNYYCDSISSLVIGSYPYSTFDSLFLIIVIIFLVPILP